LPYFMRSKKPRIGITLSEAARSPKYRWPMSKSFDYIKKEYYEAIINSGGIPVLLPNVENKSDIGMFFGSIDGLLVTGGADMHPRYFGQAPHKKLSATTEARDRFEIEIIKMALQEDMPILGICRGHQVLNVALGGDLHQDLSCVGGRTLQHSDSRQTGKVFHDVRIDGDSILHEIIRKKIIGVNSSHHQVVNRPGRGLLAVAFAPDGMIEGLEHADLDFVVGIQWHPERIYSRFHSKRIFDYFVKKASENM